MIRYTKHDLPHCAQWALLAGQALVQRNHFMDLARRSSDVYRSMYVKWARDWNHRLIVNIRESKDSYEKLGT